MGAGHPGGVGSATPPPPPVALTKPAVISTCWVSICAVQTVYYIAAHMCFPNCVLLHSCPHVLSKLCSSTCPVDIAVNIAVNIIESFVVGVHHRDAVNPPPETVDRIAMVDANGNAIVEVKDTKQLFDENGNEVDQITDMVQDSRGNTKLEQMMVGFSKVFLGFAERDRCSSDMVRNSGLVEGQEVVGADLISSC